jgi:hypothetical protein
LLNIYQHSTECDCCGLDPECPLKAHVWKAWSLVQQCLEMGPLGSAWITRALTSSMGSSTDGFKFNGLLGGDGSLGGGTPSPRSESLGYILWGGYICPQSSLSLLPSLPLSLPTLLLPTSQRPPSSFALLPALCHDAQPCRRSKVMGPSNHGLNPLKL